MGAHPISLDQLEAAHWLVVGTTGSGKTYLARGLLEQLRRADRRVGAIDKLGKLWGLTLAADGQAPGLEFVIFGGKRPGAIPMTPDQGAQLGRIFVDRNVPAIFDLSQWKAADQERWVAAFANELFYANETALHLLFDEAQSWVPQGGGGPAYEAVRLLAEQGRGNGINLLLTAPRLSGLDANVRGAIAAMVAMRQTSDVDSKRTAELVAGHLAIDARAFRSDLPTLPTGTGFVWSPTGSGLERVAFPPNATFDSSRTPRHGDTPPAPIAISSALVDELRAALAPAPRPDDVIPADERDEQIAQLLSEKLRDLGHIASLERQLRVVNERVRQAVEALTDDFLDRLFEDDHSEFEHGGVAADSERKGPSPAATSRPERADVDVAHKAPAGTSPLPPRRLRILAAIAWSAAYLKRPDVPRTIVAWIADVSATSSSFANDLGALRSTGLVDYPGAGLLGLTLAGLAAAPAVRRPRTRGELWAGIHPKLPPRQVAIVENLWSGERKAREQLATDVGASPSSSSFANDLGRLRSLGLIDYPESGIVHLAELLR